MVALGPELPLRKENDLRDESDGLLSLEDLEEVVELSVDGRPRPTQDKLRPRPDTLRSLCCCCCGKGIFSWEATRDRGSSGED